MSLVVHSMRKTRPALSYIFRLVEPTVCLIRVPCTRVCRRLLTSAELRALGRLPRRR